MANSQVLTILLIICGHAYCRGEYNNGVFQSELIKTMTTYQEVHMLPTFDVNADDHSSKKIEYGRDLILPSTGVKIVVVVVVVVVENAAPTGGNPTDWFGRINGTNYEELIGRNIKDFEQYKHRRHATKAKINLSIVNYFLNWSSFLKVPMNRNVGYSMLNHKSSSEKSNGNPGTIMARFWPFSLQITEMNQKLAIYGMTKEGTNHNIKNKYYKVFYDMYNIPVPLNGDEIELSFNDPKLARFLSSINQVNASDEFLEKKLFTHSDLEKEIISKKVSKALEMINRISPELYMSINQLISCIAVYKSMSPTTVAGSSGTLPGVIYINANPKSIDWSVEQYMEIIVHEYIHNALFLQEFVLGTYRNRWVLSRAKVFSAIRRVPRRYDLSLHAAYVAAGLVAFHREAGLTWRAEQLAATLRSSVDELVAAHREHGVLTDRGEAMLDNLAEFVASMNITK